MWLKPDKTGLGVDIFVDDGMSYQRHEHELLLFARNGNGRECSSFIPFSISDKPCVLDDEMDINLPYETVFHIQDFIQSNLRIFQLLASQDISQEAFVQNIQYLNMNDSTSLFYSIDNEPLIVAQTRRLILEAFADLTFQEDGHIYTLNGKQLHSASSIGQRFESRPFEKQKIAIGYAQKHGETPEYWIEQWDCNAFRATTLGTKTHEFGESMGYLRSGLPDRITPRIRPQYMEKYNYLAPIHPKEEAIVKFFKELPAAYHLVLNEAMAYSGKNPDESQNLKEQICGTFDMLYYYDGEGDESKAGFVIMDYKSNGKLYNENNQKYHTMLLSPFDDLVQEDYGLYTIQLSLYALMLQDIGVNIIDRRLIWLKDDATYETISVPDVTDRLRKVL